MLQQIVVQEEDGASKIWSKTNGWVVKLPGFHSVCASPTNKKKNKKIILFKDIESLGAAKAILDTHENVQSTQQMGFKTIVKQVC